MCGHHAGRSHALCDSDATVAGIPACSFPASGSAADGMHFQSAAAGLGNQR